MRLPTKLQIADYWMNEVRGFDVDPADFTNCWMCTQTNGIERCHIVPKSLGGSDECSNLVLMCEACHGLAPDTPDPLYMRKWMQDNRLHSTDRGTYEKIRHVAALLSGAGYSGDEGFDRPTFIAALSKCATHFGRGISEGSIAWAAEQAIGAAE